MNHLKMTSQEVRRCTLVALWHYGIFPKRALARWERDRTALRQEYDLLAIALVCVGIVPHHELSQASWENVPWDDRRMLAAPLALKRWVARYERRYQILAKAEIAWQRYEHRKHLAYLRDAFYPEYPL